MYLQYTGSPALSLQVMVCNNVCAVWLSARVNDAGSDVRVKG